MGMPGLEAVMDAATVCLKASLPAKIAELNAIYAVKDAYQIQVPHDSAYLDGIDYDELESEMLSLPNPSVIVHGGDVVPIGEPDVGNEYTLGSELAISVLFTAQTIEERTRMAMRYRRAVKEVLLPDEALTVEESGGVLTCVLTGEGYLEKTIPAGVYRDAVCLFTVTTYETP